MRDLGVANQTKPIKLRMCGSSHSTEFGRFSSAKTFTIKVFFLCSLKREKGGHPSGSVKVKKPAARSK